MTEQKDSAMDPQAVTAKRIENFLQPFDPVDKTIAEFEEKNQALVFDYEDKKGNKDARSWVYTLRQLKSSVSETHKVLKADFLAVTRALDNKRASLLQRIETMIEVHAGPIKAIEEREAAEKQYEADWNEAHEANMEWDRQKAIREKEAELQRKEAEIAARQAELERAEREAQIARQAAEKREREILEAQERQRLHDEAKAKQEAQLKAAEEEQRRRMAEDVRHRQEVNVAVFNIFANKGMPDDQAEILLEELQDDCYAHLKLIY